MKSLRCIVFVAAGPETESMFLGATTPEALRWTLARLQPWLEGAYAQAYALPPPNVPQILIKNERGALDPQAAEEIVKKFLESVRSNPPAPPNDSGWVKVGVELEHATKITRQYLETELGQILWKDTIRTSEAKKEAKALLRCTAPFVTKTKRNGEFVALIDRVAFLDEIVARISEKLDVAN
jgi:hypothetical protein